MTEVLTQAWIPTAIGMAAVMITAILGLQAMAAAQFEGKAGEILMIIFMSTGILLLIFLPFGLGLKLLPAVCIAAIGAKLTKAPNRSFGLMLEVWFILLLFFVILGIGLVT